MLSNNSLFAVKSLTDSMPPLFIMLSGLPCTGKSTWRARMVNMLENKNITARVISADDLAYQIRDEYNQTREPDHQVTYKDICNQYRSDLEKRYKNAVIEARKISGIVILDRTYLAPQWRKAELDLIKPNPVHMLVFDIQDELAWNEKLKCRNETNSEKLISEEIIKLLSQGASEPKLEEGFLSITKCHAIGEPKWEETFDQAIANFIDIYNASDHYNPVMKKEFEYSSPGK